MKKLMFAAAAAFCGTVFALESANVVGYQEVDVPTGSSMKTSTFKPMAGEYKISEIKITGAAGGGMDYATKINPDGSWGQTYFYLTMDGTGYVEDGWYKDDFGGDAVTDEDVLSFGEAFQITASSDFVITYAGQVVDGVPTVAVPQGSSMVGNPTPVNVKLSQVKAVGAAGGGMDYATKINPDGSWGQTYFYLTMDGTGYVEDGWYKDDFGGDAVNDDDALAPGESFQFTATANISLQFPAVL